MRGNLWEFGPKQSRNQTNAQAFHELETAGTAASVTFHNEATFTLAWEGADQEMLNTLWRKVVWSDETEI